MLRKNADTAIVAEEYRAHCIASTSSAGRNAPRLTPSRASGARKKSDVRSITSEATTAEKAIMQTPRNLPSTRSRSRTGSESSISIRPTRRSSLHESIPSSTHRNGSTGTIERVHNDVRDILDPSAGSSEKANSAADTARNAPMTSAVEQRLRARPIVREQVTDCTLIRHLLPTPRQFVHAILRDLYPVRISTPKSHHL